MNMSSFCVALYPGPVRRRWGAELQQQIEQDGPRAWSDAVLAAANLWLHPALWPETKPGEKRCVMAVFAVAITSATALVMRATGPQASDGATSHGLGSVWLVVVLAGMLAAAPIPDLRVAPLCRLARLSVRTLALPLTAGLAIVLLGNSHLVDHATGAAHAALVTGYWLTLILAGARACALVGRTAGIATPPGPTRIRLALALICAGLALAAAQVMVAFSQAGDDPSDLIATGALATLVAVLVINGRDLRATA